jgi:hypothetical protein
MEFDTDTVMNRIRDLDPAILEDDIRTMSLEFGSEKVAGHIARSMDRNIVIDGPGIERYVSERLNGVSEDDIRGLASDYQMDTPEGMKEIASQLITEDVVDSFADVLVDLVSIGRDSDVKVCIESIVRAVRGTECPLTKYAGDYVSTYTDYLLKCLEEKDPLKAFIQEEPAD